MATRRINGTLDTFSVDSGSEISYVGGSTTGDKSDDVRGFEVNPGGTGNIIVNLEKTSGIRNVQIFQKMHLMEAVLHQDTKDFLI